MHNVLFSSDYKKEFEYLFRKKASMKIQQCIFLSAKDGCGAMPRKDQKTVCNDQHPENVGQDWDTLIRNARRNILTKIERVTEAK